MMAIRNPAKTDSEGLANLSTMRGSPDMNRHGSTRTYQRFLRRRRAARPRPGDCVTVTASSDAESGDVAKPRLQVAHRRSPIKGQAATDGCFDPPCLPITPVLSGCLLRPLRLQEAPVQLHKPSESCRASLPYCKHCRDRNQFIVCEDIGSAARGEWRSWQRVPLR